MNIFFLDQNPKQAAMYSCDKHCVKMILESIQMLSTTHHLHPNININNDFNSRLFKLSFKNHPCTLWVRSSLSNYNWLSEYAYELCKEYTHRYDKIHKNESLAIEMIKNTPDIIDIGFTNPPLAMPKECFSENLLDYVDSYRRYYFLNKKHNISCTWKKRDIPEWFK